MKKIVSLCMMVITFGWAQAQTEISGVNVADKATIGGEELILNGAGLREKLWIDLYVGSLYLQAKTTDAKAVMNNDKAMALRLNIVSKLITSDKMIKAVNEGFEQSTKGNTAPIQTKIETFKQIFSDEIKKGDQFDILYKPDTGVVVYKNGKNSGTIEGLDFKKALFGIWFCSKPADKKLKKAMLGI